MGDHLLVVLIEGGDLTPLEWGSIPEACENGE